MAEDALKIRRSVKTRFTRKKNVFFKAMAEDKGTEILRTKFKELTDAWFTVEGKHDIFLMYLSEEEIATSEKWIDKLQYCAKVMQTSVVEIRDFSCLFDDKKNSRLNCRIIKSIFDTSLAYSQALGQRCN